MNDHPCDDCTMSTLKVWHGFTHGCTGCAARAVARGPHYHRCGATGLQDRQYRAHLDQMGVTHQAVREAAQGDRLGKL